MKKRHALVLGATGLVGSRCVLHLERSAAYESVTCLVRRAGQLSFNDPKKMREDVVDFDTLAELEDKSTIDDVYIAIGSTMKKAGSEDAFRRIDFDIPLKVAKLANERGARRIALVSSVGAAAKSGTFYLRVKGELEEALEDLQRPAQGVLHAFRPSFLVGDRKEGRAGEAIATTLFKAGKGLLFGGLRKYRPIDVDQVARAMVAAMVGSDPSRSDVKKRMIYEYDAILGLAGDAVM